VSEVSHIHVSNADGSFPPRPLVNAHTILSLQEAADYLREPLARVKKNRHSIPGMICVSRKVWKFHPETFLTATLPKRKL